MKLDWLQDKRLRFVAQTLPSLLYFVSILVTLANQLGYFAVVIAVVGALLLVLVGNRIVERAAPESSGSSTSKHQPQAPETKDRALHPVCDVGPYKVEAGDIRSIPLNANQSQRVKGHFKEIDRQPFDWYIADEKNMILLENGQREEFSSIDEGYDKAAYRVSRKIPWKARWFLIIDTYGKQNSRKVRVDFEPLPYS